MSVQYLWGSMLFLPQSLNHAQPPPQISSPKEENVAPGERLPFLGSRVPYLKETEQLEGLFRRQPKVLYACLRDQVSEPAFPPSL